MTYLDDTRKTRVGDFQCDDITASSSAIGAAEIASNAVTNAKMANNAVNTAELTASAVTDAKIKSETLTGTVSLTTVEVTVSHTLGVTPSIVIMNATDNTGALFICSGKCTDSINVRMSGATAVSAFQAYLIA